MYIMFTVIIVPFAGLDMYGLLHVVTQKDFVRIVIKLLDNYLNLAKEQSKKHGQIANQVTVIFDMEGFNLKQYLWKPGKKYMGPCAILLSAFCRFHFYCCLIGAYHCSWRAGYHLHPNVRGKLSGNSKEVLSNQR